MYYWWLWAISSGDEFDWTTLPYFTDVFPTALDFSNAITDTAFTADFKAFVYAVLTDEFHGHHLVYQEEAPYTESKRRILNQVRSRLLPIQKKWIMWKATLDPTDDNKDDFLRIYQNHELKTDSVASEGTTASKVARTPSDIVPSTDYVEDYTNEQWKGENTNDLSRSGERTFDRQAGLSALWEALDRVPRSIVEDVCDVFVTQFLTVIGLGELPTL